MKWFVFCFCNKGEFGVALILAQHLCGFMMESHGSRKMKLVPTFKALAEIFILPYTYSTYLVGWNNLLQTCLSMSG